MNRSILPALLVAGLAVGNIGCSVTSEVQPDWTHETDVRELASTAATSDGRWVAIADGHRLSVIDGESGATTVELDEAYWRSVTSASPVGGFFSSNYKMRLLEDAGVLLLFDFRFAEETVTGIDLASGEVLWETSELAYSLDKYEGLIADAASSTANVVANVLGGESETESREDRLARQHRFYQRMIHPVEGSNHFLFKTFDGLRMMDARTGGLVWHVPGFQAAGLHSVERLPDGDWLVLGGGSSFLDLTAAGAYHLARIDASGQEIWRSEYSGEETHGMQLAGERVVVDAKPLQVFDLVTGEKLWENNARRDGIFHPAPVVTDSVVYQAANNLREDIKLFRAGTPYKIRAYDLDSGRELWVTEESQTDWTELTFRDGLLLAVGAGDFFADANGGVAALDAQDGQLRWKSPAFESSGVFSRAVDVSELVVDDERLFLAGPGQLHALSLADGEPRFQQGLAETGVGALQALLRNPAGVTVVGRDGVSGLDPASGRVQFSLNPFGVNQVHERGDRLVLEATGGTGELTALDLSEPGPAAIMRYRMFGDRLYGDFDGQAFVTENGRHVFVINADGNLQRFTL